GQDQGSSGGGRASAGISGGGAGGAKRDRATRWGRDRSRRGTAAATRPRGQHLGGSRLGARKPKCGLRSSSSRRRIDARKRRRGRPREHSAVANPVIAPV